MTLPALVVLAVVVGYPIVRAVMVSFFDFPLLGGSTEFTGGANYQRLAGDSVFWQSLRNTGIYTGASVLAGLTIGLVLALATENLQGPWRTVRGLLLTPWAVPFIVVAFVFRFMFQQPGGITNALLQQLGLVHAPVPWLTSSAWAMVSVIIANVWSQAPFFLLIFTAALGTVPTEVVEAARVDRARTWSMVTRIKLPYLRSAALVGALLMVVQNFNSFPLIWAMTEGGPGYSTSTLLIYVYRLAFTRFDLGYASAIGVVWLALLLLIAAMFIRMMRERTT